MNYPAISIHYVNKCKSPNNDYDSMNSHYFFPFFPQIMSKFFYFYTPPSKNLKINGRIIGGSDILFCQRKCQKWNMGSFNLSKKVVVTGTV